MAMAIRRHNADRERPIVTSREAVPVSALGCTRCGSAVDAATTRCAYCLTDLTLPGSRADHAAVVRSRPRRTPLSVVRDNLTWPRLLLLGVAMVAAWTMGGSVWGPGVVAPELATGQATSAALPQDWGFVHGDATMSRATSAPAHLGQSPRILDVVGAPSAPGVIGSGVVYVPLATGPLIAVDASSGALRWERAYDHPLASAPVLAAGRLIVLDRSGRIESVEASTGERLWQSDAYGGFASSPVVHAGSVFAAFRYGAAADVETGGVLVQLDIETGALLWRVLIASSYPIVDIAVDASHVVVVGGNRLSVFDRQSGEETFFYRYRPQAAFVSLVDDVVYVRTPTEVSALDPDAGRPWWDGTRNFWQWAYVNRMAPRPPEVPAYWHHALPRRLDPTEVTLPLVVSEGVVVVPSASGTVAALDAATGTPLWDISGDPIVAAPVGTRDGLLVPTAAGLRVIDVATGTETGRVVLDDPWQLIPTEIALYVITGDGHVVSFRPSGSPE